MIFKMIRRNVFAFILNLLCQNNLANTEKDIETNEHAKGYKYEDVKDIVAKLSDEFPVVNYRAGITEFLMSEDVEIRLVSNNGPAPEIFDWIAEGVVSPVKHQGLCAACWAFSTVGAIESHVAIYTGKKLTFSEQFLIDCLRDGKKFVHCTDYPLLTAYRKIVTDFGGVMKTNEYRPYTYSYKTCGYTKLPKSEVPIIGFARVLSNEEEMARQLYFHGPLSAAINSKSMDVYERGFIDIPSEEFCSSDPFDMDHAVVIVGYSFYVTNYQKIPYWIIKNSWGAKWGNNGFYYLIRGRNACGIANDVSYPILSK